MIIMESEPRANHIFHLHDEIISEEEKHYNHYKTKKKKTIRRALYEFLNFIKSFLTQFLWENYPLVIITFFFFLQQTFVSQ